MPEFAYDISGAFQRFMFDSVIFNSMRTSWNLIYSGDGKIEESIFSTACELQAIKIRRQSSDRRMVISERVRGSRKIARRARSVKAGTNQRRIGSLEHAMAPTRRLRETQQPRTIRLMQDPAASEQTTAQLARVIDWQAIERDYRAGIKPLRTIAGEHGISGQAVHKRAMRDNWPRDLTARISEAAAERVVRAAVQQRLTNSVDKAVDKARSSRLTETAIIEASAEISAQAQLQQRDDVREQRQHVTALARELSALTFDTTLREQLDDAINDPARPEKLRAALERVCSLHGRIKQAKELSEALERLVTLERRVLRIQDEVDPERVSYVVLMPARQRNAVEWEHASVVSQEP